MMIMKQKSLFITIDGPNGVGKTSIVKNAVRYLSTFGLDVYQTTEPTLSSLGKLIRSFENLYKGQILALLTAADRQFHIKNEILPALCNNKIVISDRYVGSSLALQRLDGLDINLIWFLNSKLVIPDLSIILTAQPKILQERLNTRTHQSRLEKNNSRTLELKYYMEAGRFLKKQGFNVLFLENGVVSLKQNTEVIIQKILSLLKIKQFDRLEII